MENLNNSVTISSADATSARSTSADATLARSTSVDDAASADATYTLISYCMWHDDIDPEDSIGIYHNNRKIGQFVCNENEGPPIIEVINMQDILYIQDKYSLDINSSEDSVTYYFKLVTNFS